MILFNLYFILNDEPVEIFDRTKKKSVFDGQSDDIPYDLMERHVCEMSIAYNHEDNYYEQMIIID